MRVGFFFQRLALDFKLHDAALDLVDFRGKGVDLHAQTGGGFIDQVDRFVGQKAIRDIALRQHRSGNDRSVLDAHAVVHFVAFFQAAQNRDRIFHRRLADKHRLEAAFERGILFDVLAIFIERGGANGAQFAASQRRFQHVGRVHRAFGRAGTHERVQLVDEQDHLAIGFGDFFQNGFETVFEFAAVLRAGHQCGEIESDNALRAQHFGNVTGNDALREALHDGRLAHARLADQNRIIFRAARENLHHAANFFVSANHRIEFASARELGEVAAVLFQRPVGGFRILRCNAMAAANRRHGLKNCLVGDAVARQKFTRGIAFGGGDAEQDVLGRDVFVLQTLRFFEGALQNFVRLGAEVLFRGSGNFRQALDQFLGFPGELSRRHTQLFEQGRDNAVTLRDQCPEQVDRLDLLLSEARAHFLRGLHRFLGLHCKFVEPCHGRIISLSGGDTKGASDTDRPPGRSARLVLAVCDVDLNLFRLRFSALGQLD